MPSCSFAAAASVVDGLGGAEGYLITRRGEGDPEWGMEREREFLGAPMMIPYSPAGALVMGLGSITFSLPHFLAGRYMAGSSGGAGNLTGHNICSRPPSVAGIGDVGLAHGQPEDVAAVEGLLDTLPGIDKIKSLTEGEHVNFFSSLS